VSGARYTTCAGALAAIGLLAGPAQAEDDTSWYVDASDYACFVENIEAFLDAPSDPVVIVLTRCPEPSMSLSDLVTNSGADENPTEVFGNAEVTVTELLIYSKAELECLRDRIVARSEDLVELPKEPCG